MTAVSLKAQEFSLVNDSLQAHLPDDRWSHKLRRQGRHRLLVIYNQLNFYYFWEKRWFFVAMLVGAVMLALPAPGGLVREGWIVLTMSVVATILFVTEPSRYRCRLWH